MSYQSDTPRGSIRCGQHTLWPICMRADTGQQLSYHWTELNFKLTVQSVQSERGLSRRVCETYNCGLSIAIPMPLQTFCSVEKRSVALPWSRWVDIMIQPWRGIALSRGWPRISFDQSAFSLLYEYCHKTKTRTTFTTAFPLFQEFEIQGPFHDFSSTFPG